MGCITGDYKGLNFTFGVGASLIPVDMSMYATYTELKPISNSAISSTLGLLNETRDKLNTRIGDLTQQRQDLLNTEDYNQDDLDALNNEISTMTNTLDQLDKGIEGLEKKLEQSEDD